MSAGTELAAAIYTLLAPVATAQGASGPYDTVVPTAAAFPRIIFSLESERDENDTKKRSINATVAVRVISATSMRAGRLILDALDVVLHDGTLTLPNWGQFWVMREGNTPSLADPRDGGGYFFNVGAVYRIKLEYDPA